MAKSRSWQALSASYRSRLERGGITRAAYESGASVTAARGHARTPERPERAAKRPADYPEYIQRTNKRKGTGSDDALRRQLKKLGDRYGISDILSQVKPSERASFLAGWKIANAEWKANGSSGNSYGRRRLDDITESNPDAEKALGFYH